MPENGPWFRETKHKTGSPKSNSLNLTLISNNQNNSYYDFVRQVFPVKMKCHRQRNVNKVESSQFSRELQFF